MKHRTTLIVLSVLVGAFALLMWVPARSQAEDSKFVPVPVNTELAAVATQEPSVPEVVEPTPAPQPEPSPVLSQYLEDAMLKWVRLPDCEKEPAKCEAWKRVEREEVGHARERFHSIANDIAQAAAVEKSPYSNDALNGHMAEIVLTLAFMESRFREYVDDGRCNDIAWQESEEGTHLTGIGGTCDFAKRLKMVLATSMWQIHADQGIVLLDSTKDGRDSMSLWAADQVSSSEDVKKIVDESSKLPTGFGNYVTKETIRGTENRLLAARTAWHLIKGALRASKLKNLCAYTGEWGDECPKGTLRLEFARKWWEKHPLVLQ